MTVEVVEIPRHPDCAPGTWWWTEGERAPTVSCKGCQALHQLDHLVEDDGSVYPTVVCTRCGWHKKIKLLGWDRGRMDFREPA
jgi:hypothetical protein